MEFWDEIIKSLSDSLFSRRLFDNFDKSITYNRITESSKDYQLINYSENLDHYKKVDLTGTVTFETVYYDSICSYYVLNKNEHNSEPTAFYNVPPYCIHKTFIGKNEELYVYETGFVKVYHRKLDDCGNFIKKLLAIFLFFLPALFLTPIGMLLELKFNIFTDDSLFLIPLYILLLLYYLVLLPLSERRQDRKKKKYNKLRKTYFLGMQKGRRYEQTH